MLVFITSIIVISIALISIINYSVAIKKLEEEVNARVMLQANQTAQDMDIWLAVQKEKIYSLVSNYEYSDRKT